MRSILTSTLALVLVAGSISLAGCDSAAPSAEATIEANLTANSSHSPAAMNKELARARAATARYQRVEVAEDDLYFQFTPCLESPDGGMGYHWVNEGYFVPADELDARFPQALLYEPMRNGRLNLVALEYIVPFDLAPADGPAPVLFGQEFHHGPIPAWILHVWLWKNNPSGMFADWNPNVSCQYAP